MASDKLKRKTSPTTLDDIYLQNETNHQETKEIVKDSLKEISAKFTCVENRIEKVEQRQQKVDLRINALEQYNKMKCMEIKGLKNQGLNDNINVKDYVLSMMNFYNIKCESESIEKAYLIRVPNVDSPLIIVWFNNEDEKIRVMTEKSKFERNAKEKSGVYFNHALTKYNRALLSKVISVKSQLGVKSVYVRNGKIVTKVNQDARPKIIESFEELERILKPQNNDSVWVDASSDFSSQPSTSDNRPGTSVTNLKASSMTMAPPKLVSSSNFSVFQLNVRGLNEYNKFITLKTSVHSMSVQPDLLVFTEVKLKPSSPINLYKMDGYSLYSALRDSEFSKGGVLVYVKNSIEHECVEVVSESYDKILIQLKYGSKLMLLHCIYRPPISSNFQKFLSDLEMNFTSSKNLQLIVGDINVDWLGSCIESKKYRDVLLSFNFDVSNNLPTRPASGKIIDHFASNFSDKFSVTNLTVGQDSWFTDHCGVLSFVDLSLCSKFSRGSVTISKINYDQLEKNFQFSPPKDANVEDFANSLINATQNSMTKSTSKFNVKVKNKNEIAPYANNELLIALKLKDKCRKKMANHPNSLHALNAYKEASENFQKLNEELHRKFLNEKFDDCDMKQAWKNINDLLGRSKNSENEVTELIDGNNSITDKLEIANTFNRRFIHTEIDSQVSNICDWSETSNSKSIYLEETDVSEVSEAISELKTDSAAGPDGITTKVVKKIAHILCPLIVMLVNMIFETGKFPNCFKKAIVRPIFKGLNKNDPMSYRPISMINVIAKIIEKILYDRIYKFYVKNSFFFQSQYGFRRKSGTENAAIEVVNYIKQSLNEGAKVIATFIDLRKAFDLVNHEVLLKVLESSGLRGRALEILNDYLAGREQSVKVNGVMSEKLKIERGVIQGSVLGPLLFLAVINALGKLTLKGKIVLYADDAVLLHECRGGENIEETIKNDMRKIMEFFDMRKLELNSSKTVFMVFSTKQQNDTLNKININERCTIERVATFKYLGLHLDPFLKFNIHCNVIESKIASAAGILWKIGSKVPLYCRKNIYFALVHSHLVFMSSIWPLTNNSIIEPVQVLQNRAIRNVFKFDRLQNRAEMYNKVQILPIKALGLMSITKYMFMCLRGETLLNFKFEKQGGSTRNSSNLRMPKPRNSYGRRCFSYAGPLIYNKLPQDIKKSTNKYQLKKKMKELLLRSDMCESLLNGDALNVISNIKNYAP